MFYLLQQILEEKQKLIKEGKIKKQKPLSEITDEEIPFDIPDNWKWVRLETIVHQITDGTHKTPHYIKTGIPFLSVKNISGGNLDLADIHYISIEEHNELIKRCNPQKNDILICRIGTLGKALRIDTEIQFSIFVSLGLIKTGYQLLSDYLVNVINSGYGSNWIQSVKAGGAMHAYKINLTDLKQMIIPLPPISEQERIISIVEKYLSILDTIDKLQAQYADNLTALKSKLIDAAIQGKLTEQLPEDGTAEELYQQIQEEKQKLIKERKIKKQKPLPEISDDEIPFDIPDNWKWVRMEDITSKITSGSTPKGGKKSNAYVNNGFPFFREQNIYNDGIHTDGMVYISEDLLRTRLNSTVIAKDILLNITGGSIGRCALISDDFDRGSINQHILIIRMVKPETRFYIHQLMCSSYVQSYIKNKAVGDKDGFSGGRCKQMLIPLPPLAEKKRIVQKLDEILPLCEQLIF